MKHLNLPQALSLALLSLCLATPLPAVAKAKNEPPSLQCERDGKLQACDDQPEMTKPKKAAAFKAQAADVNGDADKPAKKKKKKKGQKTAKKKAKASVAE
jgi:hypothetical protein